MTGFVALRRLVVALIQVAALSSALACSRPEEATTGPVDELDEECRATETCGDVADERLDPKFWVGVREYVGDPRGGNDAECQFVLRYAPPRVPAHVEARIWASRGQLIPYAAAVVKLVECTEFTYVQRVYAPRATVDANFAKFASLAPRKDTVVLAFGGDALLEQEERAVATYGTSNVTGGRAADSVTVQVTTTSEEQHVHRGMAVGCTFPWGAYRATIVRIVEPSPSVVGWAEVELTRDPP
jgi:hypothetical protein